MGNNHNGAEQSTARTFSIIIMEQNRAGIRIRIRITIRIRIIIEQNRAVNNNHHH